jgi:hypothetical protein
VRYYLSAFFLQVILLGRSQDPVPVIGEWREHLPYNNAIDVTAGGGKVYCATPYSLFSVDNENLVERHSRVTGLSETGISAIKFDDAAKKLFIAYTNSNIDIIYRNDVYNVPDIKRDNITGDKTIYNIFPLEKNFYLSTGLGVIVVDGERYEVKGTWFIGNGGNQVKVNGFTSDGVYFYAATAEGLKKVAANSANPANYNNWQTVSGTNGLATGACRHVITVQGKVIVQKDDSLFVQNGAAWSLLYTDGWTIISCNSTENKIQLCQQQGAASRIIILNTDGSLFRIFSNPAILPAPSKAIVFNNDTWVADSIAGLSRLEAGGTVENYKLNAPASVATGELVFNNSTFYAAAGTVNELWAGQQNKSGLYGFNEGTWKNFNNKTFSQLDSLPDMVSLAIDKRDESIWAGSFGGGLLQVKPGPVFEISKQNQLGAAVTDPASFRVAGLAFDAGNNLWVSNFGAAQPLRVRKNDGSWKNFTPPFPLVQNALSQIIVDNNNFKWMVSPLGNGLVCFDHGAFIDNTSDDRWKRYRMGSGSGNLPSNDVLCIAKDRNGFIWAGTADGVGVIQCPEQAFDAAGCDAIWPIVPNGYFAGFLFKGQEVRSIAVDGADRKWVATKNGVFLVNAEGEKVIYRFTDENSPLLSSDVRKITIDGKTGEVWFATAKGICSFRSTATEGGEANADVLVFPNPVPPGYSGTIAIRGLVNNAIVKITELDGRLVYQTRALGGQAVWNGKNYRGQKVSSGAYLVLVSDDGSNSATGKRERTAAKIFFISK